MKKIVFVCSGNICRSPMAAALARQHLAALKIPHAIVSAGTLNIQGQPAAVNAVAAMRAIDMDISGHVSQGISMGLMAAADAIVVMAPAHELTLVSANAQLGPKIHRLWEHASAALPHIPDPVGGDIGQFVQCRQLLAQCIQEWVAATLLATEAAPVADRPAGQ